jgi:hypothetical protein
MTGPANADPAAATGSPHRDRLAALVCGVLALALFAGCLVTAGSRAGLAAALAAEKLRVEKLLPGCFWWAALATGCLLGIAALWAWAAARRRLPGWLGPRAGLPLAPPVAAGPRWFTPALLAILVVAGGLRAARLNHSFYVDENHNYVRLISGIWSDYGSDKARFRQPSWTETAFRNSTGNNGFFFTILARACHDLWKTASGAADGQVLEWPTRLPSLAAGLACIAAVALALRSAGLPVAGLAAAALLCLHPWHVRYSSEARGYALMMACLAIGAWFLMRALHSGRWRDWIGHGLAQFGVLWAYPGALFAVVEAQLGVALFLLWLWWKKDRQAGAVNLTRWAGGGVLAVVCAGFLLTPGAIQLEAALERNPTMQGGPLPGWWKDTLTFLAVGCQWQASSTPGNPVNPVAEGHWLRMLAAAAMAGAVAGGLVRALRRRATIALAGLAALQMLSIATLFQRSNLYHNVLFWWYALPALPGLVMLAGCSTALRWSGAARWLVFAPAGLAAAGMLSVLPPVLSHGKSDPRGVVRAARGGDFPAYDRGPLTLGLWSDAMTYDPLMSWVKDEAHLEESMARAAAEGRGLFVLTAHEGKAAQSHPEIMRRLRESGEFELVLKRWGLESPVNDNSAYRYRGAKIAETFP